MGSKAHSCQVNSYIASDALPGLRKFLIDSDKILAACNQIVYNVVTPALKGKARLALPPNSSRLHADALPGRWTWRTTLSLSSEK